MEAPAGDPRWLRLPLQREVPAAAEGEPLLVAELNPSRSQAYTWKSSCETWSVAFSPDGAWFAWSQGHCIVKLLPWPLEGTAPNCKALERKSLGEKAEARGRGGAKEKTLECGQIVWALAFSAWHPSRSRKHLPRATVDSSCLVLATGLNDGQIKVWEVQTGRLLFSLSGHQDVVRDLSFAPSESRSILVSASRDKTLRVWDLSQNGKQLRVLSGHVQWVYCCCISPDGHMLCSAAGEKSALLWSMDSYNLLRKLEGHQNSVVSCEFSPDSALLATASYDTSVIIWDPYTGEQLRALCHVPLQSALDHGSDFHATSLRSVCFSPEGLYLATVADDRLLRIWALELGNPVAFAPVKNGLCCTYFPHGGIIATGTRDGHIQFWTTPRVLSPLKHLCRKALRRILTTDQVLALPIPKKVKEFLTYRTW
ncbi:WD repeat and SOCS box-containing protein 2 [Hemicordylus capensis]|uniref:WD repeat and SOCS box-containing protein 2 n=1 Tax=Hemicordylus capensis TaxID=884348 RepID=UPI00230433B3|nr:WD repeat and SOCS box-containing protein 2 [Hemicordylus capensis]